MANDLIGLIVRINIALAVGVLAVLALRVLVRRAFGARIAYALWLLPVLAAGAYFLPPRIERLTVVEPPAPVSSSPVASAAAHASAVQPQPVVWLAIWCAGVMLSLAILALRQGRFARALGRLRPRSDLGVRVFGAESCVHGPAVVGVFRPIIVTPADFDERFSDEERRIVLAHERAHLQQGDPLINAFVVALQCLNWFNPFIHLGARALRLDQELAADAAVLAIAARRPYAEAILKTQIMAAAPLGAAWPPNSAHSLKERIAMLKRTLPNRTQRLLGVSAIAIAAAGACAVAWAAQPAQVVVAKEQSIARADAAPFIEPPVSDPSQLAGARQTEGELQLASAETGEPTDAAKADDQTGDENAGDATDEPDVADFDTSEGDAVIVDGDHVSMRHLTPEERERVRAAVAQARAAANQARTAARVAQSQAVRQAMAQSRAAIAEAREAARAAHVEAVHAQAEAMRASREAHAEAVRSAVAAAREVNSPEMRSEIRAIAEQAAQVAHDARLTEAQREQMRAEIRAHAARLHELARMHHDCPQAHDDDEQHD
jgi:beta-lactamase regulating signal transducer with metallopeptidase domain